MIQGRNIRVRTHRFDRGKQGLYEVVTVDAGVPRFEMLNAGTEHAREVMRFPRRVEVYVSPSGRSVRVYIDGDEVKR